MGKIFISYSSNDKPWVSKFAHELINQGYDVWWDLKLLPGQKFEEVIRAALDNAECVVTVWSESSLRSVWVQEESSKALERGVLIPILHQKVTPPMPFGRIHTGDLTKWNGKPDDPNFQQLLKSIRLHIRAEVKPAPQAPKAKKISVKLASVLVLSILSVSVFMFGGTIRSLVSNSSSGVNPEVNTRKSPESKDMGEDPEVSTSKLFESKDKKTEGKAKIIGLNQPSTEIYNFDINGVKLGMTPDEIKNTIKCNYSSLKEGKTDGVQSYYTMFCSNRFVHEKPNDISSETFSYSFDLNKKLINVSKSIRYGLFAETAPSWKEIASNIINKYGQPYVKGIYSRDVNGSMGEVVTRCWGDCYLSNVNGGSHAVNKSKGLSFVVSHFPQAIVEEGEINHYYALYFALTNSDVYLNAIKSKENKAKTLTF